MNPITKGIGYYFVISPYNTQKPPEKEVSEVNIIF